MTARTLDLRPVVRSLWREIGREFRRTPLIHWNESVFRYFFVRTLLRRRPEADCHCEWRRIDLLIRGPWRPVVMEFKFYTHLRTLRLDGTPGYLKGGPGVQNFGEFCDCVRKLAALDDAPWRAEDRLPLGPRYLLLGYVDAPTMNARECYRPWYDRFRPPTEVSQVASVRTVLRRDWISCPQSGQRLRGRLLAIRPRGKSAS